MCYKKIMKTIHKTQYSGYKLESRFSSTKIHSGLICFSILNWNFCVCALFEHLMYPLELLGEGKEVIQTLFKNLWSRRNNFILVTNTIYKIFHMNIIDTVPQTTLSLSLFKWKRILWGQRRNLTLKTTRSREVEDISSQKKIPAE